MTALLAIWALLEAPPWREIMFGLVVAGLLYVAYSWAYSRGRHSRDAEVATLNTSIATLTGNVDKLEASIRQQNEAVLAARAESDAKVDAGRRALDEVRKANASLAVQATALRTSGAKPRSADAPCQISKTLAGAKL